MKWPPGVYPRAALVLLLWLQCLTVVMIAMGDYFPQNAWSLMPDPAGKVNHPFNRAELRADQHL